MKKEKHWTYCQCNDDDVSFIADQINISPLAAKVLNDSGFNPSNLDELERFMSPKMDEILRYDGLTSPEELTKSLERMSLAKRNNESIIINGDPDADGISGTTVLTTALRQLGYNVDYAFPIRSREGHGLQLRIIQEAKDKGVSLIITTDCGTKDVEAVEYARENGIDVIITDHHILGAKLPNALAIINPYMNQDESNQEYRYLSGSYVSFKWVMALKEHLGQTFPKNVFETLIISTSFGVISDRVSLKKPMNRAIVKLGIDYLNATQLPGMKALKKISIPTRSFLRARDISRTIAPRMNAPGRIGDPQKGIPDSGIIVDLLMFGLSVGPQSNIKDFIEKYKRILQQHRILKNQVDVNDQVELVDEVNDERKKMTEEIESQIEDQLADMTLDQQKVLIIHGDNWNSGVIGIDADRLRDRFVLPAIIMTTLEGSEFLKGSVRSIPTINMYAVMERVQQRFEREYGRNPYQIEIETLLGPRCVNAFGGHAQACGFSMDKRDVSIWQDMIHDEMEKLPKAQFDFSYRILKELRFFDINQKLLHDLDLLAPYGEGFDFPIFSLKRVQLSKKDARPFGNRMQQHRTPHVEFKVLPTKSKGNDSGKDRYLRATGFGLWEKFQDVLGNGHQSSPVDLIFTLDYPHKKTKRRMHPHLMVLDIRRAQKASS